MTVTQCAAPAGGGVWDKETEPRGTVNSAITLCLALTAFASSGGLNAIDYTAPSNPVMGPALSELSAEYPDDAVRVWVLFTDKQIVDDLDLDRRTTARAIELSPRALQRRAMRGMNANPVTASDLAVSPEYIGRVLQIGATLRHESRWANAISIDTTGAALDAIATLPFVRKIQPVLHAIPREPVHETPTVPQSAAPRDNGPAWYAASYDQLNQIGIVDVQNAGYTGAGIIVGILDSGFNRTHNAFNQTTNGAHPVQIIAEHDYVGNDGDTTQQPGDADGQSSHGTYILGTLAAYFPTVCVGGAFDASFILAKTEDISQEVQGEEDNYAAGLEWMESLGADMTTSSLGYIDWYTQGDLDGETAVTTLVVNAAISTGLVCCTAAGNEGHDADPMTSHLIAPADAPLILTCGAVDNAGNIAGFSSDGPTADGRVKPEILARGVDTKTTSFSTNTNIVGVNGTSLSTPLVAAGVALILQAHPDWNADKVRRALFHTAGDFEANSTYDAAFVRGYGIININAAIHFVHGDINSDGFADGRDIEPFVTALLGTNPDASQRRRADSNASGSVTAADVAIFVADLLGN